MSIMDRARFLPAPVARHAARRMRKALWYGIAILVIVGAVGVWLTIDERFYIYQADVVGAQRVSSEEVFHASGLSGLHILWARSAEIEARIMEALPVIGTVEVSCGLPADCTITVAEREPEVVWDDAERGQLWAVDADGVIFPPEETTPTDWQVRGPMPREEEGRLDENVRVALCELVASDRGAFLSRELYYEPGRGLLFVDEHGWRIILGEGDGMAERLRVAEQLMTYLESRSLSPKFVDVRFPSAPYYSLTNDW